MPFIVYDTETTGLNTAFDQILQFAAILADDDLREIDSFVLQCRRLPHIVPAPGAMLVTGVRPIDLENAPLSHYEMMVEVNRRLSAWSRRGATFLGFNSIGYDEPLLRQGFYQTLLPIYLTNTNGNTRADVMRMAQGAAVHYPGAIVIPDVGSKLEYLAEANGIVLANAHDALADARATLAVARLLRDRAPDGWQWMLRLGTRNGVNAVLQSGPVCLTDWYWGAPYTFIVAEAGRGIGSEIAVWDLAYDPTNYLDLPPEELADHITGDEKVLRRLWPSRQPMLFPLDLAPDDVRGGRLPTTEYLHRAERVQRHPTFRATLVHTLATLQEEWPASVHVEERIYEAFPSDADSLLMTEFHNAAWPIRPAIAARLSDDRLRKLALRLIYIERPDLLKANERTRLDELVISRLMANDDVPWMTIPKALHEVVALKAEADAATLDRLHEIENYLLGLSKGRVARAA